MPDCLHAEGDDHWPVGQIRGGRELDDPGSTLYLFENRPRGAYESYGIHSERGKETVRRTQRSSHSRDLQWQSLPSPSPGKKGGKGEVKRLFVKQLASQLEIEDCAKIEIPAL